MAAPGSNYFDRQQSERRWPSFFVSLGITALLFASAFAAMRSLPQWVNKDRRTASTTEIALAPPPLVPRAVPVQPRPPDTQRPSRNRVAPASTPEPMTIPAAQQPAASIVSPTAPQSARDSGAAAPRSATDASAPASKASATFGRGAPIAPAGISLDDRAANTPAVRDSLAREKLIGVPDLARVRAPTGREKKELEESQRQAAVLRQRTTTAGNSRDLVVLQGAGMNGVGSVVGPGVVSVGLPLFSSGPSAAQRKKNEKLDAEYQLRLRRLEDRMYLKRDSIRADSIRADSLRRDSLATRGRKPNFDGS